MLRRLHKSTLFKNATALLIMQVMTLVAPFIAVPYLSRILEANGFGQLVTGLSLITIASIISDFGFDLSSTYLISRKQNQKNYISKIISTVYIAKLGLICVSYILLLIYFSYNSNFSLLAIISIFIAIFFQAYQSNWVFQGIEKMRLITYSTIVSRLLYLLLVFIFITNENQYDLTLFIHSLSTILSVFISNFLIYKEGFRFYLPSKRLLKLILGHSSQFFASRVAASASSSISTLLVHQYTGAYQTGIYGASEKLLNAGRSLVGVTSQAFYPYIARTKQITLLFKVTLILYCLAAIPSAAIYYYAADILTLIFGNQYNTGAPILRIFLFVGLLSIGTTLFGYPLFAGIKRVDIANKTVIYGGVLQLTLIGYLLFTGSITPSNVAISMLFTEAFVFCARILTFIYLYKNDKNDEN